jgi:hypothetical protein
MFPTRFRPEEPELKCRALPRSDGFCCDIYAQTQLNDISAICPAIPEKLNQYYDPTALVEFPPSYKPSNFPVQERHWTFPEATTASRNHPDLKTPSMLISLKFAQYLRCRISLLGFLIPLICDGTGLGEFSVRSQRDFLRCDTKILSHCRAAHQKVMTASQNPPEGFTKCNRVKSEHFRHRFGGAHYS